MRRILTLIFALWLTTSVHPQNIIDLSGSWQFEIDRENVGTQEQWYARDLADIIFLPGSMPENDKGDLPTTKTQWVGSLYDSSFFYNPVMEPYRRAENIGFPFFLTPKRHYVGAAWYRRNIYVPQSW